VRGEDVLEGALAAGSILRARGRASLLIGATVVHLSPSVG
jgi:hypothetical protein